MVDDYSIKKKLWSGKQKSRKNCRFCPPPSMLYRGRRWRVVVHLQFSIHSHPKGPKACPCHANQFIILLV